MHYQSLILRFDRELRKADDKIRCTTRLCAEDVCNVLSLVKAICYLQKADDIVDAIECEDKVAEHHTAKPMGGTHYGAPKMPMDSMKS